MMIISVENIFGDNIFSRKYKKLFIFCWRLNDCWFVSGCPVSGLLLNLNRILMVTQSVVGRHLIITRRFSEIHQMDFYSWVLGMGFVVCSGLSFLHFFFWRTLWCSGCPVVEGYSSNSVQLLSLPLLERGRKDTSTYHSRYDEEKIIFTSSSATTHGDAAMIQQL